MIVFFSQRKELFFEMKQHIDLPASVKLSTSFRYSKSALEKIYDDNVHLAIVELEFSSLPEKAWMDVISCVGKRIPVVLFSSNIASETLQITTEFHDFQFMFKPNAKDLANVINKYVESKKPSKIDEDLKKIPIYNKDASKKLLVENGALNFLTINGSKMRSIALEYGSDVYNQLHSCFETILCRIWGATGSFRKGDLLYRKSLQSNDYYIFLQKTRSKSSVLAPGVAEKLANRIAFRIQLELWSELLNSDQSSRMPDCLKVIPEISVGYATAINNPCEEPEEIIEKVIAKSQVVSKVQHKRIIERQREILQTLIKNDAFLTPHFQAIFDLRSMDLEAIPWGSEKPLLSLLKNHLHGFESLIRVVTNMLNPYIKQEGLVYLDPRILRPDVLFNLAAATSTALELDQTCLTQAIVEGKDLPGQLMVNILPRNLYFIDKLIQGLEINKKIIFEISESEGINNFDLLKDISASLKSKQMGIAADDFGKGYAGLERIMRIQPEIIKLDRSLVTNIHLDHAKHSFVKGIVEASRKSDSTILGEGVEIVEEAIALKALGVELIQGFLLHRPESKQSIFDQLNTSILDHWSKGVA